MTGPSKLTLRSYKVGFGDCFLLTFHYEKFARNVLIDFGSSGSEDDKSGKLLLNIAADIQTQSRGKLHAVVATHRHKDHINGFATQKNGRGPGDIIASLKPDVVIQPWTEDPDAPPNATQAMHAFPAALIGEMPALNAVYGRNLIRQLSFLGESNLANISAIRNLQSMGKRNYYVNAGMKLNLEKLLPGVCVRVLGPPNLEQSDAIRKQRSTDATEYWHLAAAAERFNAAGGKRLFPRAEVYDPGDQPPHTRWFIRKMQQLRGEQLLGVVRALDAAMNNTSVILLLEVAGKKLLFPGDAQIENWSYALSKPELRSLLADVELYKVGHHGSLNGTPKTLWNLFKRRSPDSSPRRLKTLVSTMPGKHGDARAGTEVPRKKLIDALKRDSQFHTTQTIKAKDIREDIEFNFHD